MIQRLCEMLVQNPNLVSCLQWDLGATCMNRPRAMLICIARTQHLLALLAPIIATLSWLATLLALLFLWQINDDGRDYFRDVGRTASSRDFDRAYKISIKTFPQHTGSYRSVHQQRRGILSEGIYSRCSLYLRLLYCHLGIRKAVAPFRPFTETSKAPS